MKFISLIAIGSISNVGAASYTLTNNAGPVATRSVVDNAGNFITAGQASVGYFTITDAEIQAASSTAYLNSNFVVFTSGADGGGVVGETSGIRGAFSAQGSGVDLTDPSNEYSGKNVYLLVIGDSASQALVFKYDATYAGSEVNDTLLLTGSKTAGSGNDAPLNGSLLLGAYDAYDAQPHPEVGAGAGNPAFSLAIVPEPSSIALLGLGLVGFILRRRR